MATEIVTAIAKMIRIAHKINVARSAWKSGRAGSRETGRRRSGTCRHQRRHLMRGLRCVSSKRTRPAIAAQGMRTQAAFEIAALGGPIVRKIQASYFDYFRRFD